MASRSQSQSAPETETVAAGEPITLDQMTRIMDVAATLRREQALVQQQLDLDQIKAKLRERLMDAARVSGDPVTAEQLDAAVEQYYDQLHEFAEPPASWQTAVAHLWVRRGPILVIAGLILAAVATFWGLLVAGMLPGERRDRRIAQQQFDEIERHVAAIEKMTDDPVSLDEARAARATATGLLEKHQAGPMVALAADLEGLTQLLAAEYTLSIGTDAKGRSGLEREYSDEQGTRTSGYYVLVEARDAQGRPVQVPVLNRETGSVEQVSRWGEQVPAEVFERLAADKQSDGVLDDREFGKKRRGEREVEIVLTDGSGNPLARQGQITRWE